MSTMLDQNEGRIEIVKSPFLEGILPNEIIKKDSHTNPYIYYHGNLDMIKKKENISAVVGSREPDDYSLNITKALSKYLVEKEGKIILSGFARGIDTIALCTALESKGKIVAILSVSIKSFLNTNMQYRDNPNILLMSLVNENSSKSQLDYKLEPLRRNKYIYALSAETFIVECNQVGKGGTWRGATEYLEKISSVVKSRSEVFVLKRDELIAHQQLEMKGAKYFQIGKGSLTRHSLLRLFN